MPLPGNIPSLNSRRRQTIDLDISLTGLISPLAVNKFTSHSVKTKPSQAGILVSRSILWIPCWNWGIGSGSISRGLIRRVRARQISLERKIRGRKVSNIQADFLREITQGIDSSLAYDLSILWSIRWRSCLTNLKPNSSALIRNRNDGWQEKRYERIFYCLMFMNMEDQCYLSPWLSNGSGDSAFAIVKRGCTS